MSRTTLDLDDSAVEAVMTRYRLATKSDAVNFALRTLAAGPMPLEQARSMRGTGWDVDLESLRETRFPRSC